MSRAYLPSYDCVSSVRRLEEMAEINIELSAGKEPTPSASLRGRLLQKTKDGPPARFFFVPGFFSYSSARQGSHLIAFQLNGDIFG